MFCVFIEMMLPLLKAFCKSSFTPALSVFEWAVLKGPESASHPLGRMDLIIPELRTFTCIKSKGFPPKASS